MENESVDIDDVMRAMSSAMEAKYNHDKQRDEHIAKGGYSWGWHGAALISEMHEQQKLFGERLNKYIDRRIEEKLSKTQMSFKTNKETNQRFSS